MAEQGLASLAELAGHALAARVCLLLPASEMKKQLDAAGKVALQVNFATDKTDVLADSLPQIEQVAALLKQDPSLQLAVNGHTDDSGDAAVPCGVRTVTSQSR